MQAVLPKVFHLNWHKFTKQGRITNMVTININWGLQLAFYRFVIWICMHIQIFLLSRRLQVMKGQIIIFLSGKVTRGLRLSPDKRSAPWKKQQQPLLFVWLLKPTSTRSCQLSPSSDKGDDPCRSHWSPSVRGYKIGSALWKGCRMSASSTAMAWVIVTGLTLTFVITSPKETMAFFTEQKNKKRREMFVVLCW